MVSPGRPPPWIAAYRSHSRHGLRRPQLDIRMNSDKRLRLGADLALMLVAFIWGATFIVVKWALADISSTLFLALRFCVATALLAVVFKGRWMPPRDQLWPTLRTGAILGAFLMAGYILQTLGLEYTSASKAGFITGFYIPLVPFLL